MVSKPTWSIDVKRSTPGPWSTGSDWASIGLMFRSAAAAERWMAEWLAKRPGADDRIRVRRDTR